MFLLNLLEATSTEQLKKDDQIEHQAQYSDEFENLEV